MPECPVCFNQLSDTETKCSVCGTTVVNNDNKDTYHIRTVSKHSKTGPFEEAFSKLPFSLDAKKLKKYSIILAIVFIFSFVLSFFKPSNSINYLIYAKDDEIFFSQVSKNDPKKLTENYGKKYYNYDLGLYYRLSQNGERVFYFDNGSNTLYYKKSNLKGDAVYIASDVSLYDIDKSGKLVTYIKNNGDLYQHAVKKTSDPIDTDVISFISSDDNKTLLYTKHDSSILSLYRYRKGKTPENIVDYLSQLSYVSDDMKTIYYTKKGYFFKQVIGKRPVTIHKDVNNVLKVYDDGKAYFVVNNSDTHTSDLYFYNGKKSQLVFSGYGSYADFAADKPVIAFFAIADGQQKLYTAVGSKATEVKGNSSDYIFVDPNGKYLYYIKDIDQTSFSGTLYKAKVSKNGLSSIKKIDTNVYNGKFLDSGKFVYIKNYHENTYSGEVYLNEKKIGNNISWVNMMYIEQKGSFLFFEYSSELYGNMIYYNGKKVKTIDENILLTNYSISSKGDILYLKNYSEEFLVGDMYIFNGSRSKEIDVGVTHISKTYDKTDFNSYLKGSLVS